MICCTVEAEELERWKRTRKNKTRKVCSFPFTSQPVELTQASHSQVRPESGTAKSIRASLGAWGLLAGYAVATVGCGLFHLGQNRNQEDKSTAAASHSTGND